MTLQRSAKISHELPGRVRWEVPAIADSPAMAAAVQRLLLAEAGVTDVVANPLTGRVLVRFFPEIPTSQVSDWVERAIARAPFEAATPETAIAPLSPAGDLTPLKRLMTYTHRHEGLLRKSIGASFFNRVFETTPPMMIGAAVDVVTRGPGSFLGRLGLKSVGSQLFALGGLSAALWTADAVLGYVQSVAAAELANNVRRDLRNEVYQHLQRLDIAQIEARDVAEWMMVLDDDIERVADFVRSGADPMVSVIANGSVAIGTFVILSPALSVVQLCLVPPLVVTSARMLPPMRERYATARRDAGSVMSHMHGNVSSMATIASFGTQDSEAQRLEALTETHRTSADDATALAATYVPTLQMIVGAGFITTLVWGGSLVTTGQLSPGAFNVMGFSDLRLLAALGRMGAFLDDYQRTQSALRRIFDVLDMQPSIVTGERALPTAAIRGDVTLDNVVFNYESDRKVFDGLTMHFPAGQTVGLVGVSGAGKTTILKLIQRLYDATGGSVRIDGNDVRDLRLEDLRRAIAIVPQEISMFAGTIHENIAYGAPNASVEAVMRAAEKAEAHDFISKLPDGYNTRVGFGGHTLSVGQRQRIAIARVVLADRPIVLFDEATSALDHETEASVQRSLRDITANRTTIMVAHRLSTIRHADRIYVLDEGEIRETGRHEELLAADGIYASLWRVQTGEALGARKTGRGRTTPPRS